MSASGQLVAAVCGAALLAATPSLEAQSSREEWLDNCRRWSTSSERVRHCEVRDMTVAATGRLDVYAGPNGGMSITGGDVRAVTVEARIQTEGRTAEEAQARARALNVRANDGTVRVDDAGGEGSASVIFAITTPRRTDVVARAQNGPVMLSSVEGRIEADVVNGPLALRDLAGDVRANTVNGPLSVSLSGSSWRGRGIEAAAENGPVTLTLPSGYSAELTAGTVNGPLVSDLPGVTTGRWPERKLIRTRLGNGGPPVKVTTVNGPAVIRVGERRRTSSM